MHKPAERSEKEKAKYELIDRLLANTILPHELKELREQVDGEDLSYIIQKIYDLNEVHIFRLSAVEGALKKMNRIKNENRNKRFTHTIRKGFRKLDDPSKQIILAEGDSWFNSPVILSDIIDRKGKDKDLAIFSIASGGDWLLNMLSGREYIEELSILHPNWFLISAGGNDLVGSRRLATILKPEGGSVEYARNGWAQQLIANAEKTHVSLEQLQFTQGLEYLSKDFFALLMFFHLQFYFIFNGVICGASKKSKFPGMKIITQGYDYPIPSFKKGFGFLPGRWYIPFIRTFLGHGIWLKEPMQVRGITKDQVQQNILYAMIYLFNEMMIEMGTLFNTDGEARVFHIDSRGSVGRTGWADELHPGPYNFFKTGKVFVDCIKQQRPPTYKHVFVVAKS